MIREIAGPIHRRLRTRKQEIFFALLAPETESRLLDVGGGDGVAGEWTQIHRGFRRAVVLNLERVRLHEGTALVVGDGARMPFRAKSFDFVLCNALLEHVPWEVQEQVAREIRRVARRGYLVATPYKWFPVDPHTFLPFYQVLPTSWQRKAIRASFGYMRRYTPLFPLDRRRMAKLFPEAKVMKVRLAGLPAQLVAVHRGELSDASTGEGVSR